MTRRHFEALAEILRRNCPEESAGMEDTGIDNWIRTVEDIADFCARENSNFDRARFESVCGLNEL